MKTEISRDSHQPQRRYSGVYQQQGRMLTDSDWNELVEILKDRLNDALRDVVGIEASSGGGTPRQRALRIVDDPADTFKIQPGHVYADGVGARLPGDADLDYAAQQDFPLAPPPGGDYVLYADVWERTVTQLMDERLRDKGLHGADTCSRKQTIAQVKWCPYNAGSPTDPTNNPETSVRNPRLGNAELSLNLLQKTTDPDDCDPCAAELDVESKVGNYLFRVEVHDVQGDANGPTQITLKWSSENGAEQFAALPSKDDMPAGFISDKWVYEFFDEVSERHLGVHLENGSWQPVRGLLTEINEPANPYLVPTVSGESGVPVLVRRWDGYCVIDLSGGGNSLNEGVDRGVALSEGKTPGSLGYVDIGSSIEIILDAIKLELELDSNAFVAGDFWLADVREAEHDPLDPVKSILIENQAPQGIEHRYLILGRVTGGTLESNPEADRKYAFPSLSEMTRLFMAGGDGQEVMPGEPLPQPLRVGVANGEWPVQGATVRFQIEDGGGSIAIVDGGLTNAEGIAECLWSPDAVIDAECRVRATLVDPYQDSEASADLAPPVYFYANLITADQVAYVADCPDSGANSVHSHLASDSAVALDIGADSYYSVKEVLDALICSLKASHIPYDEPICAGAPTVKSLLADLDFNGDTHITVADILDTLLCRLQAQHVPYDPAPKDVRWGDINDGPDRPTTVQQAIDDLAENLESTDIRYEVPPCGDVATPTVRSSLGIAPGTTKIDQVLDKLLCEFKATDLPLDRDADLCEHLDGDASVKTVQDAINVLCRMERGGGCSVTVGKDGDYASLEQAFASPELGDESQISICLLPGSHEVKELGVSGKTSISISGQGATVLLRTQISLEALKINLSGIQFSVIDEASKDGKGTGHIYLASPSNGKVVVQNCVFSRTFFGSNAQWQPLVIVGQSSDLTWADNHMYAVRQFEQRFKVLPEAGSVPAASREALTEMEAVLLMDPYQDPELFSARVDAAAEKVGALDFRVRGDWFTARPESRISRLPKTPVRVTRVTQPLHVAQPLANLPLAFNTRTAIGELSASKVSPQDEVNRFYGLLSIDGPLDAVQMAEAIKNLAALISNIDYALAFESNSVGGWLSNNDISGYVGLHFAQPDAVPITWPKTDNDQGQGNKKILISQLQHDNWDSRQQLNMQANRITAVHSMTSKTELKTITDALKGSGDITALKLHSHQSTLVNSNIFYEDQNSFLGQFLNLNGNQFLMQSEATEYALAYSGIYMGGQAYFSGSHLEQITREVEMAANLQIIV